MAINSAYSIHLKKSDSNERPKDIWLEKGESISMECKIDDSYDKNTLYFLHNDKDINDQGTEVVRNEKSVFVVIEKYDPDVHEGDYSCSASSSSETIDKTLRLNSKKLVGIPDYARKCQVNHCRNGGECFEPIMGKNPSFCVCPDEFAGRHCESFAVPAFAMQGTKATFGLGGICTSALILSTILFAVLYRRERRKRRVYKEKFDGILPTYFEKGDCQTIAAKMSLINAADVSSIKTSTAGNLQNDPQYPLVKMSGYNAERSNEEFHVNNIANNSRDDPEKGLPS